jgi:ArsR family transcriptional regulator, arsenate/arsenite/antimonite-responsive transcriptional repressor
MKKHTSKKTCVSCFRTLADETRMCIIKTLKEEGEKNVSEITQVLRLSQPTISHHLHLLTKAGFLERVQSGKNVFYSFRKDYPCHGCGVFTAPIKT